LLDHEDELSRPSGDIFGDIHHDSMVLRDYDSQSALDQHLALLRPLASWMIYPSLPPRAWLDGINAMFQDDYVPPPAGAADVAPDGKLQ
jgi:hypothetical protein